MSPRALPGDAVALVPLRAGGLRPRPSDPAALVAVTWDAAITGFLQWFGLVRGRAALTLVTYARGLRCFARFATRGGLTDPRDVSHREIERYLGALAAAGRRPALLNQRLSALRTLYRWLEREGFVRQNPALLAVGPKKERRLPDYLTPHETARLLAAVDAATSPNGRRDAMMVHLALSTGLRCAELTGLRLDQLTLEPGAERVRIIGKGHKEREVPLVPSVAERLRVYLRDIRPALLAPQAVTSPYVFPAELRPWGTRARGGATARRRVRRDRPRGRPLATRSFYRIAAELSRVIGRPIHPHLFRHSFASRLRAAGADLQLIQELLGHESIHTTTMYAHITTDLQRATLAKLLGEG